MKLFCISRHLEHQQRWATMLSEFHPHPNETIVSLNSEKSVVIIDEESVISANEIEKKRLFSHCVMVVSSLPTFENAKKMLSLGAKGYGNMMMHPSYALSAYHAILEGNIWLSPEYISLLIQNLSPTPPLQINPLESLTPREAEVATLLAQGFSHKEIAEKLNITVRTIKAHSSAIYSRLNVKDRLALALLLRF